MKGKILSFHHVFYLSVPHSAVALSQELLHHTHRIEVPVKCLEGKLYVRLSAHVYNYLDEYTKLASVIKKMSSVKNTSKGFFGFI